MTWFHAVAMGVLLLIGVAAYRYGDLAWFRGAFVGVIAILVGAAAVLQFRERCPRCGARLRTKVLVLLPDKCSTCGTSLLRPPAGTEG